MEHSKLTRPMGAARQTACGDRASGQRSGMTLIEVMCAVIVTTMVLGAAMNFFVGQSRSYTAAAKQFNQVQNLRFGADLLDQHLRSAGANTTPGQPQLVYLSPTAFAFNADYASKDSGTTAIYYTPGAPATETEGVLSAQAFNLPGVSPAYAYPTVDYEVTTGIPSPAELITFWFQLDSTMPTPGVFALYRQVNSGVPEAVVRNILPDTVPFFRYIKVSTNVATGLQTQVSVTPAELPASYDATSMLDSVRAVQVSYRITNGDTGTAQRVQSFSLTSTLPNLSKPSLMVCGNPPQTMTTFTAFASGVPGAPSVTLNWAADADEWGGERDIMRYIVWRRNVGAATWGSPLFTVPNGQASYTLLDMSVPDGASVEYSITAQDCTPTFGTPIVSNQVTTP
jgi:Tfp pilus assembly protein PilV